MSLNHSFYKYGVYYPIVLLRREWVPTRIQALERSQWQSPDSLRQLQQRKLHALLSRARESVPFYQQSLGQVRIGPEDTLLERFREFPTVSKQDLKDRLPEFLHPQESRGATPKTTGGSTGQPVTIWKTSNAMGWELAAQWRGYRWAGVDVGHRQARFWGVPQSNRAAVRSKLIDLVSNRVRCSAFAFSEQDMEEYFRRLNKFKPDYFYGYVSMLAQYAEFLLSRGLTHRFPLNCVIPTAEELTTSHRRLFGEAFGATVRNEYGCGELGTIAHEADDGRMYVNAENLLIEILDGDRACAPGEIGEIVVTELNNLASPLIRYRLGDFASLAAPDADRKRGLPVLQDIAGRAYDMIVNREGRKFHGEYFMYIAEDARQRGLGIGAFQVRQLSFDSFLVKIQPEASYGPATEQFVSERIRDGYGKYARVRFETVDSIPRAPSGKMRLIIGMDDGR